MPPSVDCVQWPHALQFDRFARPGGTSIRGSRRAECCLKPVRRRRIAIQLASCSGGSPERRTTCVPDSANRGWHVPCCSHSQKGLAMMQGLITSKHVLWHAGSILRNYGVRRYLRCVGALLSGHSSNNMETHTPRPSTMEYPQVAGRPQDRSRPAAAGAAAPRYFDRAGRSRAPVAVAAPRGN
jgi:hypothetical protein